MRNKFLLSLLLAFTIIIGLGFTNRIVAQSDSKYYDEKPTYSCEVTRGEDETLFDLELLKNSVALLAREEWKKGDIITFELLSTSGDASNLEFGILVCEDMDKGWSYNDYGGSIKKSFDEGETKVNVTVPHDGEFGIIVVDQYREPNIWERIVGLFKKDYFNISFKVNKDFKNPIAK